MYPLNDKDLDRLSREAAEQYDVESNASGWEQLQQRLNKEMPVAAKKDRRRFLWFLFLLALLSGGGLTWLLTNTGAPVIANKSGKIVTEPSAPKKEKISDATPPTAPASKTNEAIVKDQKSSQNKISNTKNEEKINLENTGDKSKINEPGIGLENRSKPGNQQKIVAQNSGTVKAKRNKTDIARGPAAKLRPAVTFKDRDASNVTDADKTPRDQNAIASKDNKDAMEPNTVKDETTTKDEPQKNDIVKDEPVKAVSPADNKAAPSDNKATSAAKKKQQKNDPFKKSRFEIGLVTGIDNSAVKSTRTGKMGYNLGVQIGYNLSNRWSLNTGAIFTRKNYGASGEDYHPPKHYWTNYVDLKGLEGYCEMWDIPLNVRYNITTGNKFQWFASTGLSTYIMSQQYYKYYYTSNNLPDIRDWENNSQENYWLSILNLSAGFEKRLNRHFSLQGEPFVKIPVRGVGYGRMKISTYGAFFTVKFLPGAGR